MFKVGDIVREKGINSTHYLYKITHVFPLESRVKIKYYKGGNTDFVFVSSYPSDVFELYLKYPKGFAAFARDKLS